MLFRDFSFLKGDYSCSVFLSLEQGVSRQILLLPGLPGLAYVQYCAVIF